MAAYLITEPYQEHIDPEAEILRLIVGWERAVTADSRWREKYLRERISGPMPYSEILKEMNEFRPYAKPDVETQAALNYQAAFHTKVMVSLYNARASKQGRPTILGYLIYKANAGSFWYLVGKMSDGTKQRFFMWKGLQKREGNSHDYPKYVEEIKRLYVPD